MLLGRGMGSWRDRFVFAIGIVPSDVFPAVLVTLAEVALRDRDLAVRAITELDSSVTASKVGADQFLSVLNVLGDDKVRSLQRRESNIEHEFSKLLF